LYSRSSWRDGCEDFAGLSAGFAVDFAGLSSGFQDPPSRFSHPSIDFL
jgi:hypothetical protein